MRSQGDTLAGLGARIRAIRKERGIQLNELAERSDLSSAFLSRLERGQVSSSVANLIQIAQALGVSVSELFDDATAMSRSEASVHKVEDADAEPSMVSNGYRWRLLAGGKPNDDLEIFHLVFPRKDRMRMLVSHQGQEYCYVLSGKVRFFVGDKAFELGPGEGILTNSEIPHRAENIGRTEAQILMVVTKSQPHAEHFDWWTATSAVQGAAKAAAPAKAAANADIEATAPRGRRRRG